MSRTNPELTRLRRLLTDRRTYSAPDYLRSIAAMSTDLRRLTLKKNIPTRRQRQLAEHLEDIERVLTMAWHFIDECPDRTPRHLTSEK